MKVAIATCKNLPEPDVDEQLLFDALRRHDVTVRMLPWDDASCDVEVGELVVIRSTWNYFERVDDFVAWTGRVSERATLMNPASIVHANAKKTYLRDLEARGIQVVPTEYVSKG